MNGFFSIFGGASEQARYFLLRKENFKPKMVKLHLLGVFLGFLEVFLGFLEVKLHLMNHENEAQIRRHGFEAQHGSMFNQLKLIWRLMAMVWGFSL